MRGYRAFVTLGGVELEAFGALTRGVWAAGVLPSCPPGRENRTTASESPAQSLI